MFSLCLMKNKSICHLNQYLEKNSLFVSSCQNDCCHSEAKTKEHQSGWMLDEDEEDRVDETALQQLTEMGFPESRAIKALRLNQ